MARHQDASSRNAIATLLAVSLAAAGLWSCGADPATEAPDSFGIGIPGDYVGTYVENGRESTLDFSVSEQLQVTYLAFTENLTPQVQKEVVWELGAFLEATRTRWRLSGTGEVLGVGRQHWLTRSGSSLTVESSEGDVQMGFSVSSDALTPDPPGYAQLRLTRDGQGLFAGFNLEIPAAGRVTCPDGCGQDTFRATQSELERGCAPRVFVMSGLGGSLDHALPNQMSFRKISVNWQDGTVCRIRSGGLLPVDIEVPLAGFIELDEATRQFVFEGRSDIVYEFRDDYLDFVAIWIGPDGYGEARVEGDLLPFPIRRVDLEDDGRPLPPLDWRAMNSQYQPSSR